MKVNTKQLHEQAEQLRNMSRKTLEVREEVSRIHGVLRMESVGDEFTPALRTMLREIEDQAADIELLGRALRTIAEHYETCEERIVDRAEGTQVIRGHIAPGCMSLVGENDEIPSVQWEPWDGN